MSDRVCCRESEEDTVSLSRSCLSNMDDESFESWTGWLSRRGPTSKRYGPRRLVRVGVGPGMLNDQGRTGGARSCPLWGGKTGWRWVRTRGLEGGLGLTGRRGTEKDVPEILYEGVD